MGRQKILVVTVLEDTQFTGKRVHFVGIGGISMSGLALMLQQAGALVSGSDWHLNAITDRLAAAGATLYEGHAAEHVGDAELVVYTAAASADNPELVEARRRGIPVWERAKLLGALMKRVPHSIGVAGTHGKTTTSSMVATIFVKAGRDPSIHLGAELPLIGGNARPGQGDVFITEACEYKDSFLSFPPTVAVLLNIDRDHLDYFHDLDHIERSFAKYVSLLPREGLAIGFGDDERVCRVLAGAPCPTSRYGYGPHCEWRIAGAETDAAGYPRFVLHHAQYGAVPVQLGIPGLHNCLNAAAAIATAAHFGIDPRAAAAWVGEYAGASRRFQRQGTLNGAPVIHDYAHHPTEVRATIAAVRPMTRGRVWCVFQPHTYTRTRLLFPELVEALATADRVILPDIYAAREPDDGLIHSAQVAQALAERGCDAQYEPDFDQICARLRAELQPGDTLLVLGAGDIVKLCDRLGCAEK